MDRLGIRTPWDKARAFPRLRSKKFRRKREQTSADLRTKNLKCAEEREFLHRVVFSPVRLVLFLFFSLLFSSTEGLHPPRPLSSVPRPPHGGGGMNGKETLGCPAKTNSFQHMTRSSEHNPRGGSFCFPYWHYCPISSTLQRCHEREGMGPL